VPSHIYKKTLQEISWDGHIVIANDLMPDIDLATKLCNVIGCKLQQLCLMNILVLCINMTLQETRIFILFYMQMALHIDQNLVAENSINVFQAVQAI